MTEEKMQYMSKEDFDEWVEQQPLEIQWIAKKYPPGKYRIKEGAPYAISCAGTIVDFYSYNRGGLISVIVQAKNKLQSAKQHEFQLGAKYKKTLGQILDIQKKDVMCQVDPKWLELIDNITTK